MDTPKRHRIRDRLGAWVARNLAAPDPHPEPSRLDEMDRVAHANRDVCNVRHDSVEQPGVFFTCSLAPEHVGPHECRIAGPSRSRIALWADGDDARRDEWLRTVGATDPDTPLYFEALASWEAAKEYDAKRLAFTQAPDMVTEVEAFLEEATR